MASFGENVQKPQFLTLNPPFTVSEKTKERFPRHLKTDGRTMEGRTNKGDYYGPHWVNPRSKKLSIKVPPLLLILVGIVIDGAKKFEVPVSRNVKIGLFSFERRCVNASRWSLRKSFWSMVGWR